ncbi:hypothetical protein CSQ89_20605 [Chitinimonas sp. BJB300]|nr:hypothetical protein CSQ89_20605 [Chitinimonas sp. BJB300]
MPYPNLGNRITIRKIKTMQNLNAADIAQVSGGIFTSCYTQIMMQKMERRRNKSKDEVPPSSHASLMANAPVGK